MDSATWGNYDNDVYIKGIRQGDRLILRSIYDEFQPNILAYLSKNGVQEEDAKDIFASAMVVAFQKAKDGNLVLTSPFSAYLFSICKNLMLKTFRSKKRLAQVTDDVPGGYSDDAPLPDEHLEKVMLNRAIWEAIRKLAKDCQKIILMRWDGESYEKIKELLGHSSEGYTRKRKHVCYQHLLELLRNDGRIQELL